MAETTTAQVYSQRKKVMPVIVMEVNRHFPLFSIEVLRP